MNVRGCFGDGKCPLRPAMAAVRRTDGTGGPGCPGTDRRHPVLVFAAPFAQADVEHDLGRTVAVRSMIVRAERTASDAHSTPAPTAPRTEAADSHARTAHLTSRPIRRKKVRRTRGDTTRTAPTAPREPPAPHPPSRLRRRRLRSQPLTRSAREPTPGPAGRRRSPRHRSRRLREPAPHRPAITTPRTRRRPPSRRRENGLLPGPSRAGTTGASAPPPHPHPVPARTPPRSRPSTAFRPWGVEGRGQVRGGGRSGSTPPRGVPAPRCSGLPPRRPRGRNRPAAVRSGRWPGVPCSGR